MPLAVDIRNLVKTFGSNQVLRGLDLQIASGKTTVIIGGSGSGKSVLMKHMIGLLKPESGQVLVEGEDITRLKEGDLVRVRSKFGMVFQQAALFDSMTVGDNVAFPLREHRHMKEDDMARVVAEKLALVDLKDVEHLFPAELSGGMRKRVGLARAIVLEPRIILYDEPTTGLDPITANSVDEMIMNTQERLGVTSVVISHDIDSTFRIADQVAMIHEGVIVESGTPRDMTESRHPQVQRFLANWFRREQTG